MLKIEDFVIISRKLLNSDPFNSSWKNLKKELKDIKNILIEEGYVEEELTFIEKKGVLPEKITEPIDLYQKPTFLNVSFDEKEDVKKLGAKWSEHKKMWYIPANIDRRPFKKWRIKKD